MNNLVLITSIIKTPNLPLSYINTRSIYSHKERYEQTKKTIETIKEKIPNRKILLVECSEFSDSENEYFTNNCDYILNLYNIEDIRKNIYSISKSLCEGTMTYHAINFIINNNIHYDNLIKISGRYWLSNKFNYDLFENEKLVIKYIDNNKNNVLTALYKLPKNIVNNFKDFLYNSFPKMLTCIGYEFLFSEFINEIDVQRILSLNPIGLEGFVSVSGGYYYG